MTTAFNLGIGGGALVGALLLPIGGVELLPWSAALILSSGLALLLASAENRRRKGSAGTVIV
jgi:predicted MFS family arabinose efflux permease